MEDKKIKKIVKRIVTKTFTSTAAALKEHCNITGKRIVKDNVISMGKASQIAKKDMNSMVIDILSDEIQNSLDTHENELDDASAIKIVKLSIKEVLSVSDEEAEEYAKELLFGPEIN